MSTSKLTRFQQQDVERARALAAATGAAAVAAEVEAQTGRPVTYASNPYPEAFGLAAVRLGALLDIIDSLTGGAS